MKYRLVILLPVFVLSAAVVYGIVLMFPYYLYALWPQTSQFFNKNPFTKPLSRLETIIPQTTPQEILSRINVYRATHNLTSLQQDPDICTTESRSGLCQNCSHTALVSISRYASPDQLLNRLLAEPSVKNDLNDPLITDLCPSVDGDMLSLLFTRRQNVAEVSPAPAIISSRAATAPIKNISESELWQALTVYRKAQGRTDLTRDDKLCTYARKRVDDQITKMAAVEPTHYPNPAKYPLDAHQGFAVDAESGYAFSMTGTTHLAENLAYYPGAQNAVQIIEWGWDSSTEGHREAQLSNDWTKACLSGKAGFFVAIFGS